MSSWTSWVILFPAGRIIAHMNMAQPMPRGYKDLPGIAPGNIDYSIKAPTTKPCQGKPAAPPRQTLHAGSNVHTVIEGGATHGGGHCQFALSYDGVTFVTLLTVVDTCLIDSLTYEVPLPATAPASSHAVYAWTWINRIGNREYYWNCADVVLDSAVTDGSVTGPKLLVVNIMGQPIVPEWQGTDKVGTALLEKRPIISITNSGGVSTLPSPPPGSSSDPFNPNLPPGSYDPSSGGGGNPSNSNWPNINDFLNVSQPGLIWLYSLLLTLGLFTIGVCVWRCKKRKSRNTRANKV